MDLGTTGEIFGDVQSSTCIGISVMTQMWPSIFLTEDDKIDIVDGLAVAFFVNVQHRHCAEDIASAIEQVVSFAGAGAFRYYVDEEGDTRPLNAKTRLSLISGLRRSAAEGEGGVYLIGDDVRQTATDIYYFGQGKPNDKWPDWRNVLSFHLPRELFMDRGATEVRAFVQSLAQAMPFSFGYASPCLSYGHNIVRAAKIARRYPGFDIADPIALAPDIGNKMAGVYWLSFLGQALAASLGGSDRLRAMLSGLADVTSLPNGKVELQIAAGPVVGDINRKDNLPGYRAVAQLLEPQLYIPNMIYFREDDGITTDKEAMLAWHRRFLESP